MIHAPRSKDDDDGKRKEREKKRRAEEESIFHVRLLCLFLSSLALAAACALM
jgi:hypothetical protein